MIPDKIFVDTDPFGSMHAYYIENHPPYGEEYIRKYALLEWAKGEIMPGNSAEGKGWNMAMQTLIDKIESL